MLILASASPRRHELLEAAGIAHTVRPAHIPELRRAGEPGPDFVQRIARDKAFAIVADENDIVLSADTAVCVDDQVFGKPKDEADAARMLRALAGRDHWVWTGICLRRGEQAVVDKAVTRVSFTSLSPEEIGEYTRSGEPMDKAGAYAIQGRASKFISGIEGSYQNVVGLPVAMVYGYLKTF